MFHEARDGGMSVRDAAAKCWNHYPNHHVVEYEVWEPTAGNDGARRGPDKPHFLRTKKRGRKRKITPRMLADAKQLLRRSPKMSNEALAQCLNWYFLLSFLR